MSIENNPEYESIVSNYEMGLLTDLEMTHQVIALKTRLYIQEHDVDMVPTSVFKEVFSEEELKVIGVSHANAAVEKVGWGREAENSFEVSRLGNELGKKFSAFNARFQSGVYAGMTIEEVYQGIIKGYRNSEDWSKVGLMAGKGKPPLIGVNFYEHKIDQSIINQVTLGRKYAMRTERNALADATIAIATDFTTGGEIKTKSAVEKNKKLYLRVDVSKSLVVDDSLVINIVNKLNDAHAKMINIAGNGIYSLKGTYTQKQCDDFTYNLLKRIAEHPELKNKIVNVRSGGQTGFDEAGSKAAARLGIRSDILAPNGYLFRDISGKDISGKTAFIERFSKSKEQVWEEYKELWKEWAKENPMLMAELKIASAGKILTDKFAKTPVSQARALAEILNDGVKEYSQERMFSPSKVAESISVKPEVSASQNQPSFNKLKTKLAALDHIIVRIPDPDLKSPVQTYKIMPSSEYVKYNKKYKWGLKKPEFIGTEADCKLWIRVNTDADRKLVETLSLDVHRLRNGIKDDSILSRVRSTLEQFGEVRQIDGLLYGDEGKIKQIEEKKKSTLQKLNR